MTIPLDSDGWTIADLEKLPDDGNRYELYDGSLLVSPSGSIGHANVADTIQDILKANRPQHVKVWTAGIGVASRDSKTYFIPDVVVLRAEATKAAHLHSLDPVHVMLVVEVLSPSNRGQDLVLKRHAYAAMGIPDYWIVDPVARTITVLRLEPDSADYSEAAEVRAGQTFRTARPFDVAIDPADIF